MKRRRPDDTVLVAVSRYARVALDDIIRFAHPIVVVVVTATAATAVVVRPVNGATVAAVIASSSWSWSQSAVVVACDIGRRTCGTHGERGGNYSTMLYELLCRFSIRDEKKNRNETDENRANTHTHTRVRATRRKLAQTVTHTTTKRYLSEKPTQSTEYLLADGRFFNIFYQSFRTTIVCVQNRQKRQRRRRRRRQ